MGKKLSLYTKEDMQMVNKHRKLILTSLFNKKLQIKINNFFTTTIKFK